MTKDEAMKLALEALETELAVDMTNGAEVGEAAEKMCEAITAIKAALEAKDELVCVCGAVWEGQELVIAPPEEAKDEIDWRDMYEKQKRHTEMWVAKYEKDIGPLEKAVPHQEAKDEPVAWRDAAIRLGEELSSVGPDSYYDMNAKEWLDWAMKQKPRGEHSLPQRTWDELTLAEVKEAYNQHAKYQIEDIGVSGWINFADALQTILRSKNDSH